MSTGSRIGRFGRLPRVLVAGTVVALFVVAACTSSSSDGSSSDTKARTGPTTVDPNSTEVNTDPTTTQAIAGPAYVLNGAVSDSSAWARDLLNSTSGVTAKDLDDPTVYVKHFKQIFPTLLTDPQVVGGGDEAPTNGMSATDVIEATQPKGITNAFGFAVKDSNGACAGAVVLTYDDGSAAATPIKVAAGSPCTGQAMLDTSKVS